LRLGVSSNLSSGYSVSVDEAKDLSEVIGENARRIRTDSGATMEAVVRYAKHAGMKWTTARVVELERGKLSPSLPTVLVLAYALRMATRSEAVTLAQLVQYDGLVRLNDGLVLRGRALEKYLSGKSVDFGALDRPALLDQASRTLGTLAENLPANLAFEDNPETFLTSYGLGDERAAKALGLTKRQMMEQALTLWGHNLSTERDKRAGSGASAQKRGQVTRQLLNEARKAARGDG
jgi:transcriptional regulator with XRE-family HTH domain